MIIMKPITATRVEIAAMAKKLDDLPILGVEITFINFLIFYQYTRRVPNALP